MTKVQPEIHCVDVWSGGIPRHKLAAYQAMIDAGQITRRHAVANKSTGAVAIEYLSTIPHDWIRQEMGQIARELSSNQLQIVTL